MDQMSIVMDSYFSALMGTLFVLSVYSLQSEARSAEQSEFIISSREARSQCVNHVWVLVSCKLAALIFTYIYLMVSAMTSYSSLTSRGIFVSRQHSTESDFQYHQWPRYSKYLWRAVFSSSAKQCLLSVNLKPFFWWLPLQLSCGFFDACILQLLFLRWPSEGLERLMEQQEALSSHASLWPSDNLVYVLYHTMSYLLDKSQHW